MTKKKPFKFNTIEGYVVWNGIVLWRYSEGGEYDGTDRLSMDVMRWWFSFVEKVRLMWYKWIMFEGDRFACSETMERAAVVYLIESKDAEKRNSERQKPLSNKFYKSRVTKVNNIREKYKDKIVVLQNDTDTDLLHNEKIICQAIWC